MAQSTDATGALTQYRHDSQGRLIEVIQADGSCERYAYPHPKEHPLTCDSPSQIEDAQGGIKRLQWSDAGLLLAYSDCSHNTTGYTYNRFGELIAVTDALGQRTVHHRDRQGRIIACEHLGRRVVRFEYDGSITVLADSYGGKRLNSPNDVVVKSDGSVWFTDPPFGILGWYEGEKHTPELPPTNVYRIDGQSGEITCVADDIDHPNGLAFSPDESILYIVESRSEPRNILAYDVNGATLRRRGTFVACQPGETPDGFRVDIDGNLWCGWGMTAAFDGVRIYNNAGAPIGHVHLPERCANLCFGGRHRNRLFMAAAQSLYSLYVGTQGVAGG